MVWRNVSTSKLLLNSTSNEFGTSHGQSYQINTKAGYCGLLLNILRDADIGNGPLVEIKCELPYYGLINTGKIVFLWNNAFVFLDRRNRVDWTQLRKG
jgi:hypothetical protein